MPALKTTICSRAVVFHSYKRKQVVIERPQLLGRPAGSPLVRLVVWAGLESASFLAFYARCSRCKRGEPP
eukprot:362139-Chlamydomonas_euryale.AAC.6